jgi:tetratricopeptide (TPR) repeat protein
VPAELSVDLPAFSIKADPAPQLTVYGRGALRWDSVARAAAFITSTDPAVAAFARPPLVAFETQIQSLGKPGQNLLQAMLLFEALKQHGVRYLADSNTPYTQASANRAQVDYIQYPAEVLQKKTGDCDDLTALYCALLENAGVATALVDYPEHIFLLFDSGLSQENAYQLPLDGKRYLVRGETLWIPLEITRLDQTFLQAWQIGTEELAKLSGFEQRRRIVDTAEAWQQYPAAAPSFEVAVTTPAGAMLEEAFADQYDALKAKINAYIGTHYLDPLKQTPNNNPLRQKLIQLYLALRQYDTAISTAVNHLLKEVGDKAATYNQLGIAYFLKGDIGEAALQFKQAVALRSDDKELQRNLDRALQKLNLIEGQAELQAVEVATNGETKGVAEAVGVNDFYWLE